MKKKIPGFNGYFADSNGNIWNSRQKMSPFVDRCGYQRVNLIRGGQQVSCYVQRLVCSAFKGVPPNDKPICIRKVKNQQARRIRRNRYLKWGNYKEIKRSNKNIAKLTFKEKSPKRGLLRFICYIKYLFGKYEGDIG